MGYSEIAALTAGVLMVAAMATTSMRWLRILALGSGLAALAVAYLVGGLGTVGNLLLIAFVIVNAVQLVRLVLRTRAHHLSAPA